MILGKRDSFDKVQKYHAGQWRSGEGPEKEKEKNGKGNLFLRWLMCN